MTSPNRLEPFKIEKDDVQYNYKRTVFEQLQCETCESVFLTHIPSGRGQLLCAEEDTKLCPGCEEICRNLDITEKGGAKPS